MKSKEEKITDENPFAGFGVMDLSNTMKTPEDKVILDEEKPNMAAMEAVLEAEKAKKELKSSASVEDEDEEEEEVLEKEKVINNPNKGNDDFSYKPLVSHLSDKGILDYDEDKYKDKDFSDDDTLEEVVRDTIESNYNKRKESFSDDLKKAIEWEENGGDINQFYDYFYNKIKYADLKFEGDDTELQKAVLKDYLRSQGEKDEARIDTRIERYELGGILEDEAIVALERLQEVEARHESETMSKQKRDTENRRLREAEDWNALKKNILDTEEIQGFKVTPKQREQLLNHITKAVTKDGKTQLQLNNEKNGQKAQLLYAYLDMVNYDLSKLEKQVKNKVTSDLRKNLGKFTDSRKGHTSGRADVTHEDNLFEGFKRIM